MLTFEESQEALTEIADSLPPAIFERLNGGILLLPDTLTHPKAVDGSLYILGQYHYDPHGFGRYVTIHYGSMTEAYGHLSPASFRKKLADVLRHELVHHLESLAGDRSLEHKDAAELGRYLRIHKGKKR